MQIAVLVEPVANNGYLARSGEPLALTAEGATADEAVARLRGLMSDRLAAGARVVTVNLSEQENPWLRMAGIFKDDPYYEECLQNIAERRRQLDADPDVP